MDKLPAHSADDFATRERANAGLKIPLHTAEGAETEHYIEVVGIDSDQFLRAKHANALRMAEVASMEDTAAQETAMLDGIASLLASLVTGWSFDPATPFKGGTLGACTPANVAAFLRECPQIGSRIDEMTHKRERFFMLQGKKQGSTPDAASTSQDPPPPVRESQKKKA